MAARFSDQEIDRMIQELKPLPGNYRSKIQLREKRGHMEDCHIDAIQDSQFSLFKEIKS